MPWGFRTLSSKPSRLLMITVVDLFRPYPVGAVLPSPSVCTLSICFLLSHASLRVLKHRHLPMFDPEILEFISLSVCAGQLDLLKCEYDPPTEFDKAHLLERMYGRHFDASDTSGRGNIVVLGAHNSGTSMVTRLIMLMGAFAGNYETLSVHRHNKLKYYEPFSVSLFHDAFLGKFVDTRFRPYHGQSLNFTTMTQADQDSLDVRYGYTLPQLPHSDMNSSTLFVSSYTSGCSCWNGYTRKCGKKRYDCGAD